MFVIQYGSQFYRTRYSVYGGNWTGSKDDATKWRTQVGAERRLEKIREYEGKIRNLPERALAKIKVQPVELGNG